MRPRFLADADLKYPIVAGIKKREPRIDFQSAQAERLEGMEDSEVLAIAAARGRILVSHDYGTMPRHFRAFAAQNSSPGVFLVSQGVPIGMVVEWILTVWETSDAVEWQDRLTYLPL